MRTLVLAVAAGALLATTHANAATFPINRMSGIDSGLIEQVAVRVYVHEGRRYCFYFSGWHGPGWYRCGFAFRRGFGWGGVYGWNDWSYGPYERRYGRHHERARIGIQTDTGRSRSTIENRTRSTTGATIDSGGRRGTTGGDTQIRSRSTTGSGPSVNTQGGGGANVQGGGAAIGGGAKVQGGASSSGGNARGGGGGGIGGGTDQPKQ